MKRLLMIVLGIAVLAACSPTLPGDTPTNSQAPGDSPIYAPRAGDENLTRGEVYLDAAEILIMESYPLQFSVNLRGNLPTPCHQLRVTLDLPDAENQVHLQAYSLADPNEVCAQVLEPFEQNVYLGSFPAGHYTVWMNGELIGEFDA